MDLTVGITKQPSPPPLEQVQEILDRLEQDVPAELEVTASAVLTTSLHLKAFDPLVVPADVRAQRHPWEGAFRCQDIPPQFLHNAARHPVDVYQLLSAAAVDVGRRRPTSQPLLCKSVADVLAHPAYPFDQCGLCDLGQMPIPLTIVSGHIDREPARITRDR